MPSLLLSVRFQKSLSGFPGFKVQLLRDPAIFERVLPVARELVEDALIET